MARVKPVMNKRCLYKNCRKEFQTKIEGQQYCSTQCSYNGSRGFERPTEEEIADMLKTMNRKQIAQKYKVSPTTVSRWIESDMKRKAVSVG